MIEDLLVEGLQQYYNVPPSTVYERFKTGELLILATCKSEPVIVGRRDDRPYTIPAPRLLIPTQLYQ